MPNRFLNVEYSGITTEIIVTDMEDLSQVQDAIKETYGDAIPVAAAFIQVYDQQGQHINKWAMFNSLPQEYFDEDGLFLVIRTTPLPFTQPTQPDMFSRFATASPPMNAFWAAFQNYSGTIEANTVVKLPENVCILGNEIIGSSIYIRPCYLELFQLSLAIVQSPDIRHLIILGNSGIGKSYFGYFLLLQLARSGATVVYESALEGNLLLLSPDGVKEGSRQALLPYLRSSSTFYIVHGMEPLRGAAAKTILLSSFGKEVFQGSLYTSVYAMEDLYMKWGGIARYVLKFALVEEQQARLKEALYVSSINSVLQSFGGSSEKADTASCLIHRSVRDGFHSGPYEFASAYVVDEIYSRVYAIDRDHLIRFLSATQGIGSTGQLRAVLFEKYTHTILAKGGSFKIRDLQTGQQSSLNLRDDMTTFLYSSNDPAFQAAQNYYFRPGSRTFESVDSFIKPNILFQMTAAKDHPCKQTELRDVLQILGNPQEPQLYFVVPPDRFASFTYQSYHGTDGKVLSERGIFANVKKISQFVLTYPLSQ